ncbi:hypothetical protein QN400_18530 [Pseudomonas sp. RTC3]|nr:MULTISPECIES: hypothetical protein [unclassified Pseudomonas]MEB0064013.1 hypothetical protein [Pseudomonas sp. RTC3]MDY7564832.1 hypothetical protein [Pseudomonas sp. 5C2]MEB0005924.1 hypothetical protein [Pseudomonas sp. RTB2]MEB0017110.1 hypothetical protein [Pseudomonas sp. RTB3]MEB0026572.1 hypothetical protein [Pseudomonas sp. MH9.2]
MFDKDPIHALSDSIAGNAYALNALNNLYNVACRLRLTGAE